MTSNQRVPFAATLADIERAARDAPLGHPGAAMVTAGEPDKAPPARPIPLGEVTRRHLARVLEQQQGALLLCCVELGGGDPQGRWRLTIGDAQLEPEGPEG